MIIFYKTIVEYFKQDIDTDTGKIKNNCIINQDLSCFFLEPYLPSSSFTPSLILETTNLFFISIILSFPEHCVSVIM